MTTKVQKWGNSLAIRIPIELSKKIGLVEGGAINFTQVRDAIVIKSAMPVYKLKDLLKGMTRKKAQPEIDWGNPVGEELW